MANSKKKGSKNERELCKWFKSWTGYEFSRSPSSGGLRWQRKDDTVGDIVCTDERHSRRFGFSVETKFHKEVNFEHIVLGNKKVKVLEFWDQALEDAKRANKTPLLFIRYNGMPKQTWLVIINEDSYKLARKYGLKFHEKAIFRMDVVGYDTMYLLNSDDLLQVNYKELSIAVKKRVRKNGK